MRKEYDKVLGAINAVDKMINKDPFLDYYHFPGCVGINDLKITLSHDSREKLVNTSFFYVWRK